MALNTITPRGDASVLSQYRAAILAAAKKYGLDPILIGAIIMHESGGKAGIVNPNGGAAGLMQVYPAAHPEANNPLMRGTTPDAIAYQIDTGARILSDALKRHPGNYTAALQEYAGTGYRGPNGQSFRDELQSLYAPQVTRVLAIADINNPPGEAIGNVPGIPDVTGGIGQIGSAISGVIGFFTDRDNLLALILGIGGVALIFIGLSHAVSESGIGEQAAGVAKLAAAA